MVPSGLIEFVGAFAGGLTAGLAVTRRKVKTIADAAAREAIEKHEQHCRRRERDEAPSLIVPSYGSE